MNDPSASSDSLPRASRRRFLIGLGTSTAALAGPFALAAAGGTPAAAAATGPTVSLNLADIDRKSTRLNSSH